MAQRIKRVFGGSGFIEELPEAGRETGNPSSNQKGKVRQERVSSGTKIWRRRTMNDGVGDVN